MQQLIPSLQVEVEFQIGIAKLKPTRQLKIINNFDKKEQRIQMKKKANVEQNLYFITLQLEAQNYYKYRYENDLGGFLLFEAQYRTFRYVFDKKNQIDYWNKFLVEYRLRSSEQFFNQYEIAIIYQRGIKLELIKFKILKTYGNRRLISQEEILDQSDAFEIQDVNTQEKKKTIPLCLKNFAEISFVERNYIIYEFLEESILNAVLEGKEQIQMEQEEYIKELDQCQMKVEQLERQLCEYKRESQMAKEERNKQCEVYERSVENFQRQLHKQQMEHSVSMENLLRQLYESLNRINPSPINIPNQEEDLMWNEISRCLEDLNNTIQNLAEERQNADNKSEKRQQQLVAQRELLQNKQRQLDDCMTKLRASQEKIEQYQRELNGSNKNLEQKLQIICSLKLLLKDKEDQLILYKYRVQELLNEQSNLEQNLIVLRQEFIKNQEQIERDRNKINEQRFIIQDQQDQIFEFELKRIQFEEFQKAKQLQINSLIYKAEGSVSETKGCLTILQDLALKQLSQSQIVIGSQLCYNNLSQHKIELENVLGQISRQNNREPTE